MVFTALTCVLYLTDAVRRSEVHNQANIAVQQEIDEFRAFINESPTPLKNSKEVVEAYLSQEIPHGNEILIGEINGVLVEQQNKHQFGTPEEHQQLLLLALHQPRHGDARPSADDVRDLLLGDLLAQQATRGVFPFGGARS